MARSIKPHNKITTKKITGVIMSDSQNHKGIKFLGAYNLRGRVISKTEARYRTYPPETGNFLFYGALPTQIEGDQFSFTETNHSIDAAVIPHEQHLHTWNMFSGISRDFYFNEKTSIETILHSISRRGMSKEVQNRLPKIVRRCIHGGASPYSESLASGLSECEATLIQNRYNQFMRGLNN